MSGLGENSPRVDGPAKLRGWAQFTADVEMAGMVYAKVLRSSYPHARLTRVDGSQAKKLPGVVAVLTRDDLKRDERLFRTGGKGSAGGSHRSGEVRRRHHRRGGGRGKRHRGGGAGVDRGGIRAIGRGVRSARSDETQRADLTTESEVGNTLDRALSTRNQQQCLQRLPRERGSCSGRFQGGGRIFEDVYSSQKIQHGHIEPHAALAYWEPAGKLVIYTSTQNPSLIRAQLADLSIAAIQSARHRALRRRRLRRRSPSASGAVDGGVGAQGPSAGAVGVYSRRSFLNRPLPGLGGKDKTGVKRDGTIVARQVEGTTTPAPMR